MDKQATRTLLFSAGASRTLAGVGLVAAPALVLRFWLGEAAATENHARLLTRALGMREVAIGLGALAAARAAGPARPWLLCGAAADATDALLTLAAFRSLPRLGRAAILAVASASAVGQLYAALASGN